jgi:hypothetical protein
MDCGQLLNAIDFLTDVIAERAQQLVEDKYNLPKTGPMSIETHQNKMREVQDSLRLALNESSSKGCGPPRNPNAWARATQPPPHPKPKPTPNPTQAPKRGVPYLKPGVLFPRPSPVAPTVGAATLTLILLMLLVAATAGG